MHRVFYVLIVPVWLIGATVNNLVDEPFAAVGDSTNQQYFNDVLHNERRMKRGTAYELRKGVIMGNIAVKFLLRGAKQLLSRDRYTRTFEKSGSYTTAVNDFWAIKPRDVSTFNTGKDKGYFGKVGDRVVMVETKGKTGLPTMRIMQDFGEGKEIADEIVYKSRLSSALSLVWKKND